MVSQREKALSPQEQVRDILVVMGLEIWCNGASVTTCPSCGLKRNSHSRQQVERLAILLQQILFIIFGRAKCRISEHGQMSGTTYIGTEVGVIHETEGHYFLYSK